MADSFASPPLKTKYRTAPEANFTGMPSGVPYIIGNEAAERFSFYGLRSILIVFMTTFLMNASGQLSVMGKNEATGWFHQWVAAVYCLPILGAFISDGLLGKYRTIMFLSVVYCLGHLTLAIDDTRTGLLWGLALIAAGAGGIKPCVSAHVGDQFGPCNQRLLSSVFGWFYFSINAGAGVAVYLCPFLLNDSRFGPHWAFGLPGIFMLMATVFFWMGRKRFVHVPPGGLNFVRELFSREGFSAIGRLLLVYLFVAVFWSLWDQSAGGEWTLQAKFLDLNFLGLKILPEQVQISNAIFLLVMIPIFNYVLYPAINRFFHLTPLRKIGIGLFLMASSFAVIWWLQTEIDGGHKPNVKWQLLAYLLLTASEVMVSISGLEFSYTQAPKKMKSAVMAAWLFTVSLGNQFTASLNFLIPTLRKIGVNLDGAAYFRFFTLLMLVAAVGFVFVAHYYSGKTYFQGEEPSEESQLCHKQGAG
jgi:proton-dependent oligopeptide transporter, POT family